MLTENVIQESQNRSLLSGDVRNRVRASLKSSSDVGVIENVHILLFTTTRDPLVSVSYRCARAQGNLIKLTLPPRSSFNMIVPSPTEYSPRQMTKSDSIDGKLQPKQLDQLLQPKDNEY